MSITKQALKDYIADNYRYKYQRRESITCWLIRNVVSYTGCSMSEKLRDIVEHGCVCGCVGEVIYTSDCVDLYNKYETDIWNMVDEYRNSTGQTLGQFIDSFHDTIEAENTMKVYFLWFAIEQTAYNLLNHFEQY